MTREEAVRCIEKYLCRTIGTVPEQDFVKALDMAIEALQVDLVRCGECKHRDKFGCHNPIWGDGWANYPSPYPRDEDFCSYGERRSDG